MRYLMLAIFLLAGCVSTQAPPPDGMADTQEVRRYWAERYMDSFDLKKAIDQTTFGKGKEDVFDVDAFLAAYRQILLEEYTAEELKALAFFYESDVGQKIISRGPRIFDRAMEAAINN